MSIHPAFMFGEYDLQGQSPTPSLDGGTFHCFAMQREPANDHNYQLPIIFRLFELELNVESGEFSASQVLMERIESYKM